MSEKDDRIVVTSLGVREKMAGWIKDRGGVKVWNNINLSNIRSGPLFSPVLDENGNEYLSAPRWGWGDPVIIKSIDKFRFVKEFKEVARFRVAIRMGSNGTMLKLTGGSTKRLHRLLDAHPGSYYRFDYAMQECVIELPVYED